MSSQLPAFVYPADSTSGQSYYYNYNDIVNVSWSWDGPSGASVYVILWLSNSGDQTSHNRLNESVPSPGSGSHPTPLKFDEVQYPADGHFNLYARYEDGTFAAGPNSADVFVAGNEAAAVQCWNCTKEASSSITSASPTATTTSNSATTPVTISASLITSPQPTSSQLEPSQPTSPQLTSSQPTLSGVALGGGQIAGIVVGVVIAVAIAGILGAFYQRRRMAGKTFHQIVTTEGDRGNPQQVSQASLQKPSRGRSQELYGLYQKAEHDGAEIFELNDSGRLP